MRARGVNQTGGTTTIIDVAHAAGVSTATVSRVLNGDSRVNPTLAAKVQRAVNKLGYRPSRAARTLRTQQARVWALIIPDVSNPHFTDMVRGIEDLAYSAGYALILCNTDADADKERTYLELALAEHVVGVILAPTSPDPSLIEEMLSRKVSIVTVDRRIASGMLDGAFVNNVAGAEQAVDHLLARGYRHLACITGPTDTTTGRDRLDGFMAALRRNGVELDDPAFVRIGDFRESGGKREMEGLLALPVRPDAVLVANNLMTLGALKAVVAAGLEVPSDMAIVGFDDSAWNAIVHPPLTCVAQPAYDLGAESARLLLSRIEGHSGPNREVMLVPTLRIRESTAGRSSRAPTRNGPAMRGIRPSVDDTTGGGGRGDDQPRARPARTASPSRRSGANERRDRAAGRTKGAGGTR